MLLQLHDATLRQAPIADALSMSSNGIERTEAAARSTATRSRASLRTEAPGALLLVEEVGEDRHVAEKFIADCFRRKFDACVPSFMPRLFTLRDFDRSVLGAVGLRHGHDALYVEQYLDRPIEDAIARQSDQPCDRGLVVEVGHLCGAYPGIVRTIIDRVTSRLDREGLRWVTFAGTPSLRNAFNRLGLVPIDVGPARAESIPAADRARWGRYYDESPRVYIGSVRLGSRWLRVRPPLDTRVASE
jgi:hypothetical protein